MIPVQDDQLPDHEPSAEQTLQAASPDLIKSDPDVLEELLVS
jgi:hypothetical protein